MASDGGLVQHSCITVNTPDGQRQIQLLFGDITCLPIEDKVDVILVSAFQGDYIPTRSSLIGALHHNLGLSVRDLARNKKEDLRRHFHCWQSHPLPTGLPYGQLVCFETPLMTGFRHPAELVGDVFRALIPMFGNEEKSVITPLLATGDQNYSRPVMLQAMLDAAINWIRAGLPMKCLKIVMYKRDPSWLSKDEKKLVDIFTKMSEKIERIEKDKKAKADKTSFDVYLTYNQTDKEQVSGISKLMLKDDKTLRIFEEEQHLNTKVAFQEDILETMRKSCRVVTILTPAFLESSECMEKYNLALCVNRRTCKNILAPFYLETITGMPTYMTLVQYIDIRNRDGTNQHLLNGLASFMVTLTLAMNMVVPKPLSVQYDVFISYSHRNSKEANQLLKRFQELNPNMSIFFDRNELKTGFSWQQTLYHAVDNSSVLVALLSPDYIASTVCQEEYSLALFRHLSEKEDKMELIAVLIAACEKIPRTMAEVPFVDGRNDFTQTVDQITQAVLNFKQNKEKDLIFFNPVQTTMSPYTLMSDERARMFEDKYTVEELKICHNQLDYARLEATTTEYKKTDMFEKKVEKLNVQLDTLRLDREKAALEENSPKSKQDSDYADVKRSTKPVHDINTVYDIAFVCADYLHGAFLDALFHYRAPYLSTNFHINSEEAEMTALDLEKAKIYVLFLSTKLVTVTKDIEEVDVALARQRRASQRIVYPVVIGQLPRWPTYMQLIPCSVAVDDQLWIDVMVRSRLTSLESPLPEDIINAAKYVKECFQAGLSVPVMLALSAACDDILNTLQNDGQIQKGCKNVVINNVMSLCLSKDKSDELLDVSQLLKKCDGGSNDIK